MVCIHPSSCLGRSSKAFLVAKVSPAQARVGAELCCSPSSQAATGTDRVCEVLYHETVVTDRPRDAI